MTAYDFFDVEEYGQIKRQIDSKAVFDVCKEVRKQEVRFQGDIIPDEYRDIWTGNYLVHVHQTIKLPHEWGSSGWATDSFEDFKTFDTFMALVDRLISRHPDYMPLVEVPRQMTL